MKGTIKNTSDKVEGRIKEFTGKLTGNQQLELKGKLEVAKADIKKRLDAKDAVSDIKEDVAKKVNDAIDKNS